MKAKITKEGHLLIYRKNFYKTQLCPYDTKNPCGDWCPLLLEHAPNNSYHLLMTCTNQTLKITQDERNGVFHETK